MLMHFRYYKYFLLLCLFFVGSISVLSQNDNKRKKFIDPSIKARQADTTKRITGANILEKAKKDSLMHADSLFKADSLAMLTKSSLEQPAFSAAKDSIVEIFTGGQRKIYYYGDVTVNYGNMKLTADYMEYDMTTGTVYAKGRQDTLTKTWKGQPVMEQGGKTYKMEELRYNFNTQKARITNMLTQEADGILHGKNIKMLPDKSINMTDGKYTVCDLDEPHYFLHLTAAKVITKPSQKTVFGPAYPVIEGIPLPIGLPFGFIPKRPERATGLLMPTFGEEQARGFYMRDAGMYFVIGDYLDFSITGDVYTLGSWSVNVNSRYRFNYKCTGNIGLTYSNDQTGEKGSSDFNQMRNFAIRWSHQQDSKARPGTTFSASVNFSSPSNSRFNSTSVEEALQSQISSSISYSKNWEGKVNLSVNALHNQNSRDKSYSFTLPNVTLSISRFYPFKRKARVGKEKFYEKISFGYNTTLQNRVNFKVDELKQPNFSDKFNTGMSHNFSIGLPSFTIAKYFNFSPGISYGMNWFFRKTEYAYDATTDKVKPVRGKLFSTFGATQNYSGNISMSTRIYGTLNFGKLHRIQAIRHVISPSLSLSLSPELGTYANGWRKLDYIDKDGNNKTYEYNIYAGQIYSPPGKGKSATASISIGNNLEMKVRDLRDTTGKGVKKIKLIDQLSINTGYNFLAERFKMNNVGVSMSTSVFGKVGLSMNANFDPYAIDEKGIRIDKFNVQAGKWWQPLRLTNASASLSYSISGDGAIKGNDGRSKDDNDSGGKAGPASYYQRIYYHPFTGEYIPGGWLYYTNPNVPWSLSLNYSFSYNKSYTYSNNRLLESKNYNQTLGLSGNIKLTPKMSINLSTGFDLIAMKMTTTQVSATFDLHCFNISVSWIPAGQWQSYSFRIAANAAALADILKFRKSKSYMDR